MSRMGSVFSLMKELLLTTKLRVPRLPVQHIPRAHLVALLERGAAGPLTLVSAPAGSGKTTLLTEWARATSMPVAWLSLESADSEPARLLAYLFVALQTLDERIGQQAKLIPDLQSFSDYERVLSSLINDLTSYLPADAALVLDDYHVLEDEDVQKILSFLLEHAPDHLHLLLGTRVDPSLPLARLRAHGHLSEIHAETLRFALTEVEAFLCAMELELGKEGLRSLEQRTEGWIAGVQLAALALRGHADSAAFLDSFRGNHRFVLEYLSDEILSRQEPRVRAFLLQTSILERFSGSLCDALVEQSGSQVILEELRHANLFVSALDDTGEWYRYHALFAEGLRHQLLQQEPELVPRLYTRASMWYEEHGMPYEACDSALQAKDFLRAALLVERLANRMIGRVEFSVLRRWLDQLPAEIVAERPALRVAATWVSLTDDNHGEKLDQTIASLQQSLQEHALETRNVEWAEAHANLNFMRIMQELGRNNPTGAIEIVQQTLQVLPEEATYMRGVVGLCMSIVQASVYRLSGDLTAAERVLSEASVQTRLTDFHFLHLIATVSLIEIYEAQGELQKINRLYEQLLQMVRTNKQPLPEMTVWIAAGYAKLLLEWNKLDEAEVYVQKAQAACQKINIPELALSYRFIQLGISFARGRQQEAQALLREIEEDVAHMPSDPASEIVMQARVRLLLQRDQVDEAAFMLGTNGVKYDNPLKDPPDDVFFVKYITLARVLIAQARAYPAETYLTQALALLERLRAVYERAGIVGHLIEILLLSALALQTQGETSRALTILERAVALASPGGFVRLFADEGEALARLLARLLAQKPAHSLYIRTLLAATTPERAPGHVNTPRSNPSTLTLTLLEPLSAREQEVLALLAAGLSNQEIAARLVIAPNTAKRHVKNILGKLDAANRTQAVARAREAGLLE